MIPRILAVLVLALLLPAAPLRASDHADPRHHRPEGELVLSDLHVFPDGDRLVVALSFRPGTPPAPPPRFDFEGIEYAIHFDTRSRVTFAGQDLLRYGGTVERPESIAPSASIRFRLKKSSPEPEALDFAGFTNSGAIRTFVGLRADPFIFPGARCTNVVAFVASIPFASFPSNPSTFVVWGRSASMGKQADHAGRSLRSQLMRFDGINALPPSEHVVWIRAQMNMSIRPYDYRPDVLIFDRSRPAGFPNGRRLDEDVILLVCETGDCETLEAVIKASGLPRRKTPWKPFLPSFPYLAAPHTECPPGVALDIDM